MPEPDARPTPADVAAAAERIAPHIRRTPLFAVAVGGRRLWLKLEQLQVSGSFKARGATNALLSLPTVPERVVAASGGNHGLGVAHAARVVGARATIVVPSSVSVEKAARLQAADATVIRHGDQYADAEARARRLAADEQIPFIHPFANPAVIAGQGTVAHEALVDLDGRCDAVVVAVGGGGLLAGTALACADRGVAAIGVEPTGIPTVHDALAAGRPVDVPVASVTASALGARSTAPINLRIIAEHASGVVLVDDEAILQARDLLWDACRLAVEPGTAAALAGVLTGAVEADVPCVVLCGANTTWQPS